MKKIKVTKKATKEYVKHQLSTSKKWALDCLKFMFSCQTLYERGEIVDDRLMFGDEYENADSANLVNVHDFGRSQYANNEGFNKFDAEILTSIYKFYKERNYLSPKQMKVVFKRIPKYWKQYIERPELDKEKLDSLVLKYLKN